MNILGEYNYKVENNIKLNDDFYNSLTHLYQPLIGAQAMSLYITFNFFNSILVVITSIYIKSLTILVNL